MVGVAMPAWRWGRGQKGSDQNLLVQPGTVCGAPLLMLAENEFLSFCHSIQGLLYLLAKGILSYLYFSGPHYSTSAPKLPLLTAIFFSFFLQGWRLDPLPLREVLCPTTA